MIAVAIVASLCALGALSLFVYWMMTTAVRFYLEGEQRLGSYQVERDEAGEGLAAVAKKLGVVFLPLVESLRDNDRFGVAVTLARWEHDLVRAGMRYTMMPEQLMCSSLLSAVVFGSVLALAAAVLGMGVGGALILGLPAGLIVGLVLPSYLVKNKAMERVVIIEKRLPYAIEFM